jgi:hypothetical protein
MSAVIEVDGTDGWPLKWSVVTNGESGSWSPTSRDTRGGAPNTRSRTRPSTAHEPLAIGTSRAVGVASAPRFGHTLESAEK